MRRGWWIGAAAFGATLMYLLGPARDTRRRGHVGDRRGSSAGRFRREWNRVLRPLRHPTRAGAHRGEAAPQPAPSPADIQLIECIRSRLGHVVSNARSIEVGVANGRVALEGSIPSAEIEQLLQAIRTVPGVREIANGPVAHVSPDFAATNPLVERVRTSFNAPGSRAVMGIIGAAAAFYGVARITRGAASRSASGPTAPRARSHYMTPRALALVRNEPQRTPA